MFFTTPTKSFRLWPLTSTPEKCQELIPEMLKVIKIFGVEKKRLYSTRVSDLRIAVKYKLMPSTKIQNFVISLLDLVYFATEDVIEALGKKLACYEKTLDQVGLPAYFNGCLNEVKAAKTAYESCDPPIIREFEDKIEKNEKPPFYEILADTFNKEPPQVQDNMKACIHELLRVLNKPTTKSYKNFA